MNGLWHVGSIPASSVFENLERRPVRIRPWAQIGGNMKKQIYWAVFLKGELDANDDGMMGVFENKEAAKIDLKNYKKNNVPAEVAKVHVIRLPEVRRVRQ